MGSPVLALFLAAAGTLQARPDTLRPDAPIVRLAPVTVAVSVPFITRGGASALHVRLDSLRAGPAATVERALRELPFLHVRTNARGEAYFALRGSGSEAREVAVLIDGLPVSLGFDHRADLGVLPATGATALTVIRGIPALLYGPNVLGGVVEVALSDPATTATGLVLHSGYEHTGSHAVSASAAWVHTPGRGQLVIRGGGGYRASDGFPLPADIREPAPFDDRELRLNSDRVQRDAFLSTRYASPGGAWLSLTSSAFSAQRGTPAELNSSAARFWRYPDLQRVISAVSLGSGPRDAPWGGHARGTVSVGYDVGRTQLASYTNRSYTTVQDREVDEDRNIAGRALLVQTLGDQGELSGALTFANIRRDETLAGNAQQYEQRLYSAALETGWHFLTGAGARLRLHGGLAYDASDTPLSGDKPAVDRLETWGARLGVSGASAGGRILMHGSIGRRARFPSLRELYSGALRMFEPNPDLRAEVLRAMEAGSTVVLGTSQVQAVLFDHRIEDAIVRTTTTSRRVKRVNRDEIRSRGLELLAVTRWRGAFVSVDLTAQNVDSQDASSDRAFRTEYQPKFAGGARLGVPVLAAIRADLNARAVGSQYCMNTSSAYARLEPSMRSDAQLTRTWRLPRGDWFSALETALGIDNLADAATYDQCGLPQPGRVLRVRLMLR